MIRRPTDPIEHEWLSRWNAMVLALGCVKRIDGSTSAQDRLLIAELIVHAAEELRPAAEAVVDEAERRAGDVADAA